MANRKKRLEKGIESITKEIESHENKREKAKEEGDIELADYYRKEIQGMEQAREKKKKMLDK